MYNKISKLLQTSKNIGINNAFNKLYLTNSPLYKMLVEGKDTGITRIEITLRYDNNRRLGEDTDYLDDGQDWASKIIGEFGKIWI